MIRKIISFFRRLFTNDKFPARKAGKMDKKVKDVYNVKTVDSDAGDRKIVVLDPRDKMNK